ncbi:MAG: adenosine kinase [Dysgonamonadaceae bacterium]|nr:adenosine kinase [Dysgonamonadaceae bacterium]
MKIVGIGNALVDILVKLPNNQILDELGIAKGSMNLVDETVRDAVLKKIPGAERQMTTGGSISNTMLALRKLGEPSAFIGKVGNDEQGEFYLNELQESGVTMHVIREKQPSGTAVAMITPDGERTFCTYLGAAANMQKQDLKPEHFEPYTHLYVEGYLVQNHELIESVMKIAKEKKITVMLDLASFNVVRADQNFILHLVDSYVSILLANEEEATALTGKSAVGAINEIADKVEVAIVKEGDKGSLVKFGQELIHVPVHRKIHPVDTTAAGDYFAAGFFYGLIHDASLKKCAEIGSLLSYYIIQVVGTKLQDNVWTEIQNRVNKIVEQ